MTTSTKSTKTSTKTSTAQATWKAEVDAGTTTLTFKEWKAEQFAKNEAAKPAEENGDSTAMATADASAMAGASTTEQVVKKVEAAATQVAGALATVNVAQTVNKAALAREIFNQEVEKANKTGVAMVRKDILVRFEKEAGLTKSGANTYYQTFREKAGMVVKQAQPAVAEPTANAA